MDDDFADLLFDHVVYRLHSVFRDSKRRYNEIREETIFA